jgi:hypothetical protein
MKKVMLVTLFALLAVGLAMATAGNTAYIPTTDTLGAHNNGGRGCAGCHAPHSGGAGAGGNAIVGSSIQSAGGVEGDHALWGTDVSIITQVTLQSGDLNTAGVGFTVNFGGAQQYTSTSGPLISGIAVCLSCHDGNVSQGAMMMNQAYEQQWSLLPNGGGAHTYNGALYGTVPIPTLLGNDGGTKGDYANDHPIGPLANIGRVGSAALGNGLSYSLNGNSVTWTTTGQYATFVTNYGIPSVKALKVDAANQTPYVVCTTCHNQHIMNVYKVSASTPIATLGPPATMATYFFVAAPYNPGSPWTPTNAPSTTQFCRQCHYSHANEYYGITSVGTAF